MILPEKVMSFVEISIFVQFFVEIPEKSGAQIIIHDLPSGEIRDEVHVEFAMRSNFLEDSTGERGAEVLLVLALEVLKAVDELVHKLVETQPVCKNEEW